MKRIQYNEYGAPIQKNPQWCNLIAWTLRKIASLFYPKYETIYIWLESYAYAWGDIQCFSGIKGYSRKAGNREL